ncbi:MAG: cupredoxin domain-containing protein, partial [Candidatus Roizmanbacteria bacterium]|nr:cupredoxin domain-containing protein [Candidatus Roizmanbacteria bacterium]
LLNMNKFLLVVVFVLVLGSGLFYYMSNQSIMNQKPVAETITPSKYVSSESTSSVKEFTMTAKQWAFDPAIVTVKQGDKVILKIKSIDAAHGFALPDFNVKVDLVPNKEEIVEFVADKKGEFTFFCSVMCGEGHRDMKGKLVVE